LTLRKLFNGEKELVFGLFGHTSAKVRYKVEKVHDYLKTLRFDVSQLNLGNHSFPTHLGNISNSSTVEDPKWMRANMILGGEPYLTIETPYLEELDSLHEYINATYPEIRILRQKMSNGQNMLMGIINKRKCSDVKLKNPMANFTFNTSREHQFHINASSMIFDRHMNQDLGMCIFGILMLQDHKFTHKNLLLGTPFFEHFNVSLDFSQGILGIEGHRSDVIHYNPPAPPKPEPPSPEP